RPSRSAVGRREPPRHAGLRRRALNGRRLRLALVSPFTTCCPELPPRARSGDILGQQLRAAYRVAVRGCRLRWRVAALWDGTSLPRVAVRGCRVPAAVATL